MVALLSAFFAALDLDLVYAHSYFVGVILLILELATSGYAFVELIRILDLSRQGACLLYSRSLLRDNVVIAVFRRCISVVPLQLPERLSS